MRTRKEIITKLKTYFSTRELVCPHTYAKFGEHSWQVLKTEILETILLLREDILNVPMTCNTYHNGGNITQRGNRCNICPLVSSKTKQGTSYLSAHTNGAGFDFVFSTMPAEQARTLIKQNKDKLPYPVRIEANVSWLHIDCYDPTNGSTKVYEFK